jgi:hypothetical protein
MYKIENYPFGIHMLVCIYKQEEMNALSSIYKQEFTMSYNWFLL